jgi:hypothetical protein
MRNSQSKPAKLKTLGIIEAVTEEVEQLTQRMKRPSRI